MPNTPSVPISEAAVAAGIELARHKYRDDLVLSMGILKDQIRALDDIATLSLNLGADGWFSISLMLQAASDVLYLAERSARELPLSAAH